MDDDGHKFDQNGQENQSENQNENQNNQGDGHEAEHIEVRQGGQNESKSMDGMIHGGEPTGDASGQSEGNFDSKPELGGDGSGDELGQGYTTLPDSGPGPEAGDVNASSNTTSEPQVSDALSRSLDSDPTAVVTPAPIVKPEPKKSGKSPVIWIILTVLLFLVAAGIGAMYYLQQQNNQTEVEDLNSKVSSLQSKLGSNSSQPATVAPSTDGQDYRYIPELGVKYKTNDTNSKLTYSFAAYKDSSSVSAGFSSTDLVVKSLSVLKAGQSNPCEPGNGPLGTISRYPLSDGDTTVLGEKIKDMGTKIGNFYYTYTLPQSNCSEDKSVASLQQSSQPLVKSVFDSLESM